MTKLLGPWGLLALVLFAAFDAGAARRLEDGEYKEPLNGVAQWWRVAGAKHRTTPVVVVHGGPGGNHWNFERSAGRELEQQLTVVYWEQRGSGRSAAPEDASAYSMPLLVADLEALRTRLGAEQVDLVGYSFGAELAAEYALAHPARVRRLVLQAPVEMESERLAWTQLHGFLSVSEGELRTRVLQLLAGEETAAQKLERVWETVDGPTVDRFLFVSGARAQWNRKGWEQSGLRNTGAMHKALKQNPPPRLLTRAQGIKARTLVLVGLYDRNCGVDFARDTSLVIPDAELKVFNASAHFPDIEETAQWASAVKAFLRAR